MPASKQGGMSMCRLFLQIALRAKPILLLAAAMIIFQSNESIAHKAKTQKPLFETAYLICQQTRNRGAATPEKIVEFKRDSEVFPVPERGSTCDDYISRLLEMEIDRDKELTVKVSASSLKCPLLIELLPPSEQAKCIAVFVAIAPIPIF
jgi:hypothetical protein